MAKEVLTLEELSVKAEELTKSFNAAVMDGKSYEEVKSLENELDEVIKDYKVKAEAQAFSELKKAENPMIAAINKRTFEVLKTRDKKPEKDDKVTVKVIEKTDKKIDLLKLHDYCDGIGEDPLWWAKVQSLNKLLVFRVATDLGMKPEAIKALDSSFKMSKVAEAVECGKTPTSNTQLLKSLQPVIDAMLGKGYKASSKDVNYLLFAFSKKNNKKALSIICASHKELTSLMMDVCYAVINKDRFYDATSKEVKKADKA